MDETYLKMCEKAPKEVTEIKDSIGHNQVLYCTYHKELLYVGYDCDWDCTGMHEAQWDILGNPQKSDRSEAIKWGKLQKSDDWCEGKHWIRIPSQEDLQEMVKNRNKYVPALLKGFYEFVWNPQEYYRLGTFADWSMEQLWLAFVMKELYQNGWNGEDWVAE